jgi:hypothetical protein
MREGPDEPGAVLGLIGEQRVEPAGDPFEVIVAGGQDLGVDKQPAQEQLVTTLRQGVEVLVSDALASAGELAEQLRGCAVRKPVQEAARMVGGQQQTAGRGELWVRRSVRAGQELIESVGEDALGALLAGVVPARLSAGAAARVEGAARAGPADRAAFVVADQHVGLTTAGAGGRVRRP